MGARGNRGRERPLTPQKDNKDSKAPAQTAGAGFLEHQARELLNSIDPSAAPKTTGPTLDAEQLNRLQGLTGPGGKIDPKKLEELLQKMGGKAGGAPPARPSGPSTGTRSINPEPARSCTKPSSSMRRTSRQPSTPV